MGNTFNLSLIKRTCIEIFDTEAIDIGEPDSNFLDVNLSNGEIEVLADKIQILPNDQQEALIARLCFKLSPKEISKIYGISNPRKTFNTAQTILGYSLSLKAGERISLSSLSKACDYMLLSFVTEIEQKNEKKSFLESSHNAILNFNNAKKKIRSKYFFSIFFKRVAVFAMTILISGITVLSVNASIREKFFDWVVTLYEKYSSFRIASNVSDTEIYTLNSRQVVFGYMPKDFVLAEEYISEKRINIQYCDQSGKQIIFMITVPDTSQNLNTENVIVEEIFVNSHLGRTWIKDEVTYIVWEDRGYLFSLITELNRKDAIKVAENVVLCNRLPN